MFGYVTANKPEMKIREYEYYRGVYCGLCRALGKCGGIFQKSKQAENRRGTGERAL